MHARPFTLVLIDDASPDPRIGTLFEELARRGDRRIVLLRNDVNRGFTATANRGMTRSRADVVLLNSDTIVTKGWLDALLRCAASDARIATVTPFSNNAEICSFPRFCENNRLDTDSDPERIRDALERAAVPTYPDLPTGVGFCMFVRRAALDDIGDFDLAFGAGYGEENDFCLRAARAGWRNVLADDAFVVHAGERSFAGRKGDLGARNMDLLVRRHPHYPRDGARLRRRRSAAPAARGRAVARWPATRCASVLHVIHDHGGGTETHVRTLIDASRDRWRHYLAVAVGDSLAGRRARRRRAHAIIHVRSRGGRIVARLRRRNLSPRSASRSCTCTTCRDRGRACWRRCRRSACRTATRFTTFDFACPTITLTPADERFCGGSHRRRAMPPMPRRAAGIRGHRHRALAARACGAASQVPRS